MTDTVTACDACGSRMEARKEWLFRCPACGFWASGLVPGGGTGVEGLESLRRENFELLLDRMERLVPLEGKRLLEVGPAQGWFLEAALRRGARVHAIEPEAATAAETGARLGIEIETGFFPDDLSEKGPYDLIVFNDSFEHIPEPSHAAKALSGLLKADGILVINCPSSRGILYRIATVLDRLGLPGPLERLWQVGYPSPHVSYFDRATLARLIEGNAHLVEADWFRLPSVSRAGLRQRIASSRGGLAGATLFAGLWLFSFVLAVLPPDIQVSVFRAGEGRSTEAGQG